MNEMCSNMNGRQYTKCLKADEKMGQRGSMLNNPELIGYM